MATFHCFIYSAWICSLLSGLTPSGSFVLTKGNLFLCLSGLGEICYPAFLFVLSRLCEELTYLVCVIYCLLFYFLVSRAVLSCIGYIVLYYRVRSSAISTPTDSLSQQCHKTRFLQILLKQCNTYILGEIFAEQLLT